MNMKCTPKNTSSNTYYRRIIALATASLLGAATYISGTPAKYTVNNPLIQPTDNLRGLIKESLEPAENYVFKIDVDPNLLLNKDVAENAMRTEFNTTCSENCTFTLATKDQSEEIRSITHPAFTEPLWTWERKSDKDNSGVRHTRTYTQYNKAEDDNFVKNYTFVQAPDGSETNTMFAESTNKKHKIIIKDVDGFRLTTEEDPNTSTSRKKIEGRTKITIINLDEQTDDKIYYFHFIKYFDQDQKDIPQIDLPTELYTNVECTIPSGLRMNRIGNNIKIEEYTA